MCKPCLRPRVNDVPGLHSLQEWNGSRANNIVIGRQLTGPRGLMGAAVIIDDAATRPSAPEPDRVCPYATASGASNRSKSTRFASIQSARPSTFTSSDPTSIASPVYAETAAKLFLTIES
ncbi:MAG: hypothetical protein OXG65_02435 [Chloroflexi bacterium]|nr:hypothetical protein [Chloroflexota bacterium]